MSNEVHGTVPPPVAMMGLITGYWLSQAVGVVAKLGVADHLSNGPAIKTTFLLYSAGSSARTAA